MYTRTYSDDRHSILIPESYGGTALKESAPKESKETEDRGKNPWEETERTVAEEEKNEKSEEAFSPISKPQSPSFFSNIFANSNFDLQNIGKEELLLIAAAAFLFFSKDGDKECAIMLLLLLFLG